MGAPAKFLFDQDFSRPSGRIDATSAAEMATKIAEAEARGTRQGYAAGQADAAAETARRNAVAMEQIAGAIGAISGGFNAIEGRMETEAVEVALAVARKLSSELMSREPLTEVMALVSDCFRHLVATPHLVVRINDQLYDDARSRIESLAKQSGFEGRLVILSEPDVATGDCIIEWADGGVIFNRAAIEEKIAELVTRYVASRNSSAGR